MVDLQFGFANGAEQTRHLRVFHFLPFAGEAGALAADAVTDIMQTNMDFPHDRPSFHSWEKWMLDEKVPGAQRRQTITAGKCHVNIYQIGAVGRLVFLCSRVKKNLTSRNNHDGRQQQVTMTHLIDISVPVYQGMPVFPGDFGTAIKSYRQIAKGDSANLSELHLGSHTGTHIDAPRHFEEGQMTVDELSLDSLVGPARVLDLTGVSEAISPADLEAAGMGESRRLLLKTRNSALWQQDEFSNDYVYLSDAAADLLVERDVLLVGIDYLSIERFHAEGHHVHHALLRAQIVVLEGINLTEVAGGDYGLICLPIRIKGGDGAPARAVLSGPLPE